MDEERSNAHMVGIIRRPHAYVAACGHLMMHFIIKCPHAATSACGRLIMPTIVSVGQEFVKPSNYCAFTIYTPRPDFAPLEESRSPPLPLRTHFPSTTASILALPTLFQIHHE
ncbi:hypothetical protein Fot_18774 [Forsythia ovata]|uniref:Uncharacterized protein n=1 Tax=Forsythia ovata TaxID=205694 RepID=A0ABD1VKM5_9LAMI